MIYNLIERTSLFITLVVDVILEKSKKVECVFLVQYDLVTRKQSACIDNIDYFIYLTFPLGLDA